MGLLTIIYWVLLVLILIGAFISPSQWAYAPRVNSLVILVLFIIIGLKILKPTW